MEQVIQTDEECVRGAWKWVHKCDGSYNGHPRGAVLIMIANHNHRPFPDWAAAAAYTRERLEEVRQLREEIASLPEYTDDAMRFLFREGALQWDADSLAGCVIGNVRRCRILSRLESILADKTAGMKEGA